MSDLSEIIITTPRLTLVPISHTYAKYIFEELTDEITRYMFPRTPERVEEANEYIDSVIPKMKKGEELIVVILDKDTNEFLGGGGITKLNTSTPELGIWIKKSAHKKGYGKEVITSLYKWLDEKYLFHFAKYPVDKHNLASRKIAESLGGKIEDEYTKENKAENILDIVEYRIYKKRSTLT